MNKKCELFSTVSIPNSLLSTHTGELTEWNTTAMNQYESHKTAVYKHFNLFISVSIHMQHDSCAIFFCCSLLNFGFCTENVEDALSEMCKCFVVLCDGALLWFLTRTFPEMYGAWRIELLWWYLFMHTLFGFPRCQISEI